MSNTLHCYIHREENQLPQQPDIHIWFLSTVITNNMHSAHVHTLPCLHKHTSYTQVCSEVTYFLPLMRHKYFCRQV